MPRASGIIGRMELKLTPHEQRVIGCLIEKQASTPEQYPLSLNALTNACNQKSNRDPVIDLGEAEVQAVVDRLASRFLVSEQRGYGSRVSKFEHRLCNTSFGTLQFSPQELAVVCELMLRGPQTPGELRSRASRLAPFADVGEVEKVLDALASRADGPFVMRLAREPGRRESRHAHLFGDETVQGAAPAQERAAAENRLDQLEQRLAKLEAELDGLRKRLDGS